MPRALQVHAPLVWTFCLATLFLHLLSGFLGICFVFVLFEVTELIYFFISPQLGQSLTPRHQPGVY